MFVVFLRKHIIPLKLQKLKIKLIIIINRDNLALKNVFNARLSRANLVTKTHFDATLSSFKENIPENKTKHLFLENELNKLKTFDSSYVIVKSNFEEGGTKNHLVFQSLNKYFKIITNTKYILSWQTRGLSEETIKPPAMSDYKLNPKLSYFGTKTRLDFRRSCLKQDKIIFNHGKIVNICTVYELDKNICENHPYASKLFIWRSYSN